MNKKTKRLGISLIIALCILAGVIGIYIRKKAELQQVTDSYTYSASPHFDWFYACYEGRDGSLAVITRNDRNAPVANWLGDGLFVGSETDYTRVKIYDKFDHMDLRTCEDYVYDIFEQKIVKTIDFIPIMEEYVPGYYFFTNYHVDSGEALYAVVSVSDYVQEESDRRDIWINLETEEVWVLPEGEALPEQETARSGTEQAWREDFYKGEESIWELLRAHGYTAT